MPKLKKLVVGKATWPGILPAMLPLALNTPIPSHWPLSEAGA